MRILFPVEVFFPSQAGGSANTVYWLVKSLKNRGFKPVIISSDRGLPDEVKRGQWNDNEAGRTVYVRSFIRLLPFHVSILSLLEVRRADIVHLSSLFYPAAFVTAIAARLAGRTIVWSTHGELYPEGLSFSSMRKRPVLFFIRHFLVSCSLFHATCEAEKKHITDSFGDAAKVVVLPNYFDMPAAVKPVTADQYLLFIGRVHPIKGIENLLTALTMSESFQNSGLTLKIAGNGESEYVAKLKVKVEENSLSERVEFVGQVEGEKKEQLLAGAKWTILPSQAENFGLVVIESLAQSTPVIASHGTPWQSLEESAVGFWCGREPEALAATLERALTLDQAEYQGYRDRARPFVAEHFDIAANDEKWPECYRRWIRHEA